MTADRCLRMVFLPATAAIVACSGSTEPAVARPPAPTGLTATPGNQYVSLTWAPVDGVTLYNVYWNPGPVTPATGLQIVGVRSPYTVQGLWNDTQFTFVVTALNSAGESDPSAPASATPQFSDALVIVPAALPIGKVGRIYGSDYSKTLICLSNPAFPGQVVCVDCPGTSYCKSFPQCVAAKQTDCWRDELVFSGFTFQAAGGLPPYTFSAASLPPGLSVNDSGQIRGTPTNAGSFDFPVMVSDTAWPPHVFTELHNIVVDP